MKVLLRNRRLVLFVVTLQEAFSAIIPFFLLSSFFSLSYFFIDYYSIDFGFLNSENMKLLIIRFHSLTSIIANISIAYFFASRLKVSQMIASSLAVATFVTILHLEDPHAIDILPYGFNAAVLINPIVSTYILKLFYPKLSLNIPSSDGNYHVYRHFNYIFVFVAAFFFIVGLYFFVDYIMDNFFNHINSIKFDLPGIILLAIRDFFVQTFWFFGLHGSRMVNALMGKDILFLEILPNLTYAEFNRLFVVIGGAGVGVGLLISLFLYVKDKNIRFITKLSIPFVLFNINTLLIYSAIVLNRFLLFPFIFLPLLNLALAYGFINILNFHFTDYYLQWNTPLFFDSFLKVVEYKKSIMLQLFLLSIDTIVYIYFVKKFSNFQSPQNQSKLLFKNLDITDELKAEEGLKSFINRQEIIEANAELDNIIRTINNNNIYIYYQPKISIINGKCNQFEALIRYYNNGKLSGPIFLNTIEQAGLAPIIDIYVCKKVKEDMEKWKNDNFLPQISVNLHPDTLKDDTAITKIIEILEDKNIVFEIIERSFLKQNSEKNLERLQNNGFKIAIDDFGTGYSSFETIIKYNIDELKLDKSLIDIIDKEKGYLVCKNITNLCHEIGSLVVSEGVETKKQLKTVQEIGIDIVQGFYYSPAIPFDEVKKFAQKRY